MEEIFLGQGIMARPGIAIGAAKFSCSTMQEGDILVREKTDPNDIEGMFKAAGIVTFIGGATSHAAITAREWPKPCVVGVHALGFNYDGLIISKDNPNIKIPEGEILKIDNGTVSWIKGGR